MAELAIPAFARVFIVLQQSYGFEQQIVEIKRIGIAQCFLVLFEDRRQTLGLFRSGHAVHILRRFLAILGRTDLRERHAVLQKILLVEPESAIGALDDANLVLIVVDGEAFGKARADAG